MRRLGILVVAVMAVACGYSEEELGSALANQEAEYEEKLEAAQEEIFQLTQEVESREGDVANTSSSLTEAQAEVERLEGELGLSRQERDQALEDVRSLQGEIDQLRLAYDPAIQEAFASAPAEIVGIACSKATEDSAGEAVALVDSAIFQWASNHSVAATEVEQRLDIEALVAEVDACSRQTFLTEPKRSGTFVVGIDIAPGGWKAPADIEDCYWQRTDANGGIIDNHFGSTGAGLTVTVRASDYSVEFDGCGEMVYQG